ncbi:MAG: hypothetical protein COS95_01835 [Ignavibacteriales bacterium CG07_land_8_20_14_0_80_59_12]|nr:MAG: hypothetical protein COS95_01835 [Ignavibacteriales bacterium CG07_land_8_20_14_0_80_59_12]
MRQGIRFGSLAASLVIFASLVVLPGCTRHPSEEEMTQLNSLKAEVTSLQNQISSKQQEKASLQSQISDKDSKLQQCATDKELVQQRLQNWK